MATRTKPLLSAALASAAAVAVVSPAIAPTGLPTPAALSKAAYELTTFSDVLSIPASVWSDVLFSNTTWGNTLGPDNYGPDWAAPQDVAGQYGYVNPWAVYCANGCSQSGVSGVAYMFFDALVNGSGKGYGDYQNWKVGLVNYLFEPNATFQIGGGSSPTLQFVNAGFSAVTWYALQGTIGQLIPQAQVPLAAAFWGPDNVSVAYNFTLSIAATLAGFVPLVGPLVGNTLLAYLGDLALSQGTQQTYQYGLSGALNYLIDLATKAVPWPTKVPWYTVPAAAAVAPAAASAVKAASTDTVSTDTKSEAEAPEGTEAGDASEGTSSHDASEGTEASDPTEGTSSHDASESTEASDSTEADDASESTPPVDTPVTTAVADTTAVAANAPAAPKRPLRAAADKVGKQLNTAIASAKAARAERVAARKAARAGAAG